MSNSYSAQIDITLTAISYGIWAGISGMPLACHFGLLPNGEKMPFICQLKKLVADTDQVFMKFSLFYLSSVINLVLSPTNSFMFGSVGLSSSLN